MDPLIRKAMGLDVKDSIIVFDEAHNLESVTEAAYSSELLLDDL